MLNHLLERVRLPNRDVCWLGDELEVAGANAADERDHLIEFRLELGLPVWTYVIEDVHIEHDPGRPVGLVDLVVEEGRAEHLLTSLESRGWVTHR